jgi:cytochrome c oxidase cbb3-type subunit IV
VAGDKWGFLLTTRHPPLALRIINFKKDIKMKFVHYLEKISDVSIYPVISFCIFGLFFLAMATYVFKTDKKHMDKNSRIPLD